MNRKHVLQSILLLAGAWLLGRWAGLIGPTPALRLTQTETQLLYLAIALITCWGVLRLITRDDHDGSSG